jgi:hypothetical protein
MKFKSLLLLSALTISRLVSFADEGMWLPMLINKNYDEMKRLGFKLTAKDIYDINNSSLKDAIVSLGFCTGEMISPEGLMLTNHHCGYGSIQYNSTVEHDYLTDGFWAKTKADELKAPEVTASFLVRMEDVTPRILAATNGLPDAEKDAKLKEMMKTITDEVTKGTVYNAIVKDVFGGNQYLLFVYEKYTDVRLVGAPPESIGKFGGDTDNWMWPRHTGDFSIFRVYMSPDGKPAKYSKDNVPYKPKKYLPISIKGIKDGDFSMVMGYPGRTNRYAFSRELQNSVEKTNPAIIKLYGKRLEVMKADMDKDEKIRIALAADYARMANAWKYYLGQNEGLKKLNVITNKKELEEKFVKFANSTPELKTKYGNVFVNVNKLYDDYNPYVLKNAYYNLAGVSAGIVKYGDQFKGLTDALKKDQDVDSKVKELQGGLDAHFKDYIAENDRKIMSALLTIYYNDIPKEDRPAIIAAASERSKSESVEEYFNRYTQDLFNGSIFASKEKTEDFLKNPTMALLEKDPVYQYGMQMAEYRKTYIQNVNDFNTAIAKEKKAFIAGLMEINSTKNFYPDANSTLRVSYGKVSGYKGKDAVTYDYYTTGKGILEKVDPNNEEFAVPDKLIDLLNKKDFGSYADKNGELPVAFISNNDITGGNSGSPVINANGELIGCAFDGNWEAMTGDLVFDKNYKKCINVDIRYVLFIIEKYAGADNLIKEMTIRK